LVGIRCLDLLEPSLTPNEKVQEVAVAVQAHAIASQGLANQYPDELGSHISRSVESIPISTCTGRLFRNGIQDYNGLIVLGKQEHWLIDPDHLQIEDGQILGTGGFGVVVKARYFGAEVAVKQATLEKVSQKAVVLNELRMCRWMHHPNLVHFLGAYIQPQDGTVGLVFELVTWPTLADLIAQHRARNSLCQLGHVVDILMGLLRGLCFLHGQSPPIAHSDVKPANIFVQSNDQSMQVKLGDLGVSRHAKPGARAIGATRSYSAPEVLRSGLLTTAGDIFSFGRVAEEVSEGQLSGVKSERGPQRLTPLQDWGFAQVKACLQDEADCRPPAKTLQETLQGRAHRLSPSYALFDSKSPPADPSAKKHRRSHRL